MQFKELYPQRLGTHCSSLKYSFLKIFKRDMKNHGSCLISELFILMFLLFTDTFFWCILIYFKFSLILLNIIKSKPISVKVV